MTPLRRTRPAIAFCLLTIAPLLASVPACAAEEPPVVGLIPKATKPIKLDGKLDDRAG